MTPSVPSMASRTWHIDKSLCSSLLGSLTPRPQKSGCSTCCHCSKRFGTYQVVIPHKSCERSGVKVPKCLSTTHPSSCTHSFTCLAIHPSIHSSAHPSTYHLSIYSCPLPFTHPPTHPSINLPIYQSVCLSIHHIICLFNLPCIYHSSIPPSASINLPIHPLTHLFTYLSINTKVQEPYNGLGHATL